MSYIVKKDSAWEFVTSSTGGLGVEFVAAEGGAIYLKDPAGTQHVYRYGAAGAGLSAGLKIPKFGKINIPKVKGKSVGGVAAPAAFPNTGKIYILESFAGDELAESDFRGVCAFVEAGGGLVGGGSATAMIFGMSPLWLAAYMASVNPMFLAASPFIGSKLFSTAKGILLTAGLNVGVQAGGGIAAFIGGIY